MWRWSRVQRHNLIAFFFLIRTGGALFYFLIRILEGKWRWSWFQRQLSFLFFLIRRGTVKIGTIQRRLAWPLRKDDTHKSRSVNHSFCKTQNVHENGRRESSEALDHTILHRISVRIQPWGRFFASSHVGKVIFFVFRPIFFINTAFPTFFY